MTWKPKNLTPGRLYPCARCGKENTHENMTFSQHTRNRYCIDFNACTERMNALARAKEKSRLEAERTMAG